MTFTIPTDDAIWVRGDLYCKTPEALQIALDTIRTIGYTVIDTRIDGHSIKEGKATPQHMEQHGWSLWHAQLDDVNRGKCRSCHAHISRLGIRTHGHTCENCGEVTFYDIVGGTDIVFRFVGSEYSVFGTDLRMTVKRWDTDEGWLYLRRQVEPAGWSIMTPDEATTYLEQHSDKWELVTEDGEQLVKLRYHLRFYGDPVNDETVIDPKEVFGSYINYDEVIVWNGEEYSEYQPGQRLPVPMHVSIYEAWHWSPLEPSERLHERIIRSVHHVSDVGYYYQDGRQAWSRDAYQSMGVFVRNFTTLDADKWDRESARFRLDGPGGIADIARFCHPDAVVENQPNIGNFLVGAAKFIDGQPLVGNEADAFKAAVTEDPAVKEYLRGLRRRRS